MTRKVLVTGGLGYIGSHTVVELATAGFKPIIVDNLSNSRQQILDRIATIIGYKPTYYNIDLCNASSVKLLVEMEGDIKGIIHFAAYKSVGESSEKPLMYYRNNLISLLNVLDAYKSQPIHFIFSSSCTVYGRPEKLPVTELTPLEPAKCPYGRTKQMCERILEDTALTSEALRVISLRYFNPVGAHESGLIGELPIGPPMSLVPVITETAIKKRSMFTVFGGDYNTKDGTNIRDYVHVIDIAKAHVCALRKVMLDEKSSKFDVYNLGTGRGFSILEIIKTFENITQVKVDYRIGERRPGDVDEIWADVSKAENQLCWKAEQSLEMMLASAWKWELSMRDSPFQLAE